MGKKNKEEYVVAGENMSLEEKEEFLKDIGHGDLITIFDGWKPRNSVRSTTSKPLDQKMTLTVTRADRKQFENYLKELKAAGEDVTISTVVRNKAMSHPDIEEWKSKAVAALKELCTTVNNKKEYAERIFALNEMIESEDDDDTVEMYYRERDDLSEKLDHLKARSSKRTQRLSGRLTFEEAELIKWRASRLCISTSDYLRMLIFDTGPASCADEHMSLVARQRFYVAIGEISRNGWGQPPVTTECSRCDELSKEIEKLELENAQLRTIFDEES